MALVRWSPVGQLAGMEIDRLHRMFSELYGDQPGREWSPAVDIYETDSHEVVLKAELPDMKREDIGLTFENNVLTIQGERKMAEDVKRDGFHQIERRHGVFSRSFTLPNTVDASAINASYKDGVLTVRLPRREEAKAKQIQIGVE
jgi:HSP20 family protein